MRSTGGCLPTVSLPVATASTVCAMSNHTIPTLIAAAALVLAGCGSDEAPAPATTTAAQTTAPASSRAYGTYVRTVTKADLDRTAKFRDEHGPNQELPPEGEYRLVIAQGSGDDVIKATDPGDFTVDQSIRLSGDVIEITGYVARASFCGPEIAAEAQYEFELTGDALTLEPAQDDPCADRDSILTGTWKRV